MEERPSPSLGLNRQHADFVASFTADLKSDSFIENSGDALRRISKAGRSATRMTDRWEAAPQCRPHLSWSHKRAGAAFKIELSYILPHLCLAATVQAAMQSLIL